MHPAAPVVKSQIEVRAEGGRAFAKAEAAFFAHVDRCSVDDAVRGHRELRVLVPGGSADEFRSGACWQGCAMALHPEEAFAAGNEVARHFEASDEPALRDAAEAAPHRRAQHELTEGWARIALGLLDGALLQAQAGKPDSRLQGHLIRARAHLAEGDREACAGDVEAALSALPGLNMLPREVVVALADLSAGVGPERMWRSDRFVSCGRSSASA